MACLQQLPVQGVRGGGMRVRVQGCKGVTVGGGEKGRMRVRGCQNECGMICLHQ